MPDSKSMVFELFMDPGYYDMWTIRPEGIRDFNKGVSFTSKEQAVHACRAIASWSNKTATIKEI